MKKIILLLFLVSGCTDNQRAKAFGGTATVDIPKGKKFVNATWKEESLWYVYRDAKEGEIPESFVLKEASSFGIIEGQVIFQEH